MKSTKEKTKPVQELDESRVRRVSIYLASSWRNEYQPALVTLLRKEGYEVYDFKDSEGFQWREVDPNWLNWTPKEYLGGLSHPAAERGYNRDITSLEHADICVMVMPCGMSASLEAGYAMGAEKPTAVYVPELREPDLMVKMADLVTADLDRLLAWLKDRSKEIQAARANAQVIFDIDNFSDEDD